MIVTRRIAALRVAVPLRAVWAAVAFVATLAVSTAAGAAPPSVADFFRKADYASVTLSPNGQSLALIAPVDGQRGLIVLDLATRAATKMKSPGGGDLLRVVWLNDKRLVVVIGDLQQGSGEAPTESGLVAVNRDGTDSRVITGAGAAGRGFERPRFVSLVRTIEGTDDILVTARDRNIRSLDVYRYNTETGAKTLLTPDSPGNVGDWVVDFDGVPRAATTFDFEHDTSAWYVRTGADAPWVKVDEAPFGRLTSQPMEFDPDGKLLYVASRRNDAERFSLVEFDVDKRTFGKTVVSHPTRDLDNRTAFFVSDRAQRKLVGLRYADDRSAAVWFDAEWARVSKTVDAALPDTVNVLQRRGDRWLVVAYSDRDPGKAYLLDTKSMQMSPLVTYRSGIDPAAMSPQRWVRYAARDGLSIPALLTVPKDSGGKPVPLVVDIHGGPNVPATAWGFDPEVQFFASRGYAVLQPQFRGTEGFGQHLLTAGYRHWGDTMQDDLEDGVRWTVDQGIVDPQRVCFYGGSYGGYAAAWASIKNASLIKCAVVVVGVTSIEYMFDNAQTDMSFLAEHTSLMTERIGDPKTERERFRRVSPLYHADRVGVPLLLAYGAGDLRVPLVHGSEFRAALDRAGKPYEWVVYSGEGHGFGREVNRVDFYGRVERFLGKYLGGIVTTEAEK